MKQGKMTPEERWTLEARRQLLGRKIVKVAYMDRATANAVGFSSRPIIMVLDNGGVIYPAMDDEGNDGGALFTADEKEPTIPVL